MSSGEPSAARRPAIENVAAIRDIGEIVQIVRGDDYRFRPAAPFDQQVDELALATRVETGRRFIEKQHGGIEHEHACQRHALLLASRQSLRRAILQMADLQKVQRLHHSFADVGLGPAHLQGAEGHFVEDGGVEQLRIGILKYETHLAAKRKGPLIVGEVLFR